MSTDPSSLFLQTRMPLCSLVSTSNVMADEIRRLNEILASSNQSFFKLYQSLLDKKKQLATSEVREAQVKAEYEKRVLQLEDSCAKFHREASVLKVTRIFKKGRAERRKKQQ